MNRNVEKTETQLYDVAQHLRTPKETELYLDACIAESGGDAEFVIKALDDVARAFASRWLDDRAALAR
jgi:DNA-binding phage protein